MKYQHRLLSVLLQTTDPYYCQGGIPPFHHKFALGGFGGYLLVYGTLYFGKWVSTCLRNMLLSSSGSNMEVTRFVN
jgi:hypothetical protein